jgi:hypothetical protein
MLEVVGSQPTAKPDGGPRKALEYLDVVVEDKVVEAVPLQQRLRMLQVEVLKLEHGLRLVRGRMTK